MVRAAGARRAAGCEGRQLGDVRLVGALRMIAGSQARYRVGGVRSGNDGRTRRALAGDGFPFLQLVGVEPDGEGSVVYQRHLHHRAKFSRLDARHVLARLRDEQLVEAFRFGG